MALNWSSRSLFLSDDCTGKMLGCGCWSEEASPLSSRFSSVWWDELELEVGEGAESDPVARLPSDPFEMNLTTSTITAAIANCIGDLKVRSGGWPCLCGGNDDFIFDFFIFAPNPYIDGHIGVCKTSFWSGCPTCGGDASQSSWLPPDAPCSQPSRFVESMSSSLDAALACCDADDVPPSGFVEDSSSSQDAALVSCGAAVGAAPSWFVGDPSSSHDAPSACCDAVGAAAGQEGDDAHPALFVVLGYLGLRDILSIEMVCKSMRAAVRSEFCSWKCIHIDSRLGEKISDADLLRLTQKSSGVLQCLILMCCKNITDQGLKAVLQNNLQLKKLGIFGNVRITHQGLLESLKSFNKEASTGIKKLRLANLATLSKVQYEELLSLLKIDKGLALHKQAARIFHADCFLPDHHGGYAPDCFLPDLDDAYALDIERCPLCDNYKVVYDCPAEGCNNSRVGTCRGCLVCIERCLQCGRCIDNEYEETFSLDSLCRRCVVDEGSPVSGK